MNSYVHFQNTSPLRPSLDLTGLPQGAFFCFSLGLPTTIERALIYISISLKTASGQVSLMMLQKEALPSMLKRLSVTHIASSFPHDMVTKYLLPSTLPTGKALSRW